MRISPWSAAVCVAAGLFPAQILAADVLKTDGFTVCSTHSTVQVQRFNIEYDRTTQKLTFDVAGTSDKVQNVTASLSVSAYGRQVYQKDFDPCAPESMVAQLCPGTSIVFMYLSIHWLTWAFLPLSSSRWYLCRSGRADNPD